MFDLSVYIVTLNIKYTNKLLILFPKLFTQMQIIAINLSLMYAVSVQYLAPSQCPHKCLEYRSM